jgi:acetyl esterase/lipase
MKKALFISISALAIMALLYHFIPLKTFNFLVPKDAQSEKIAGDVPYGADERQRLDIYRPKNAPANLPVLIFVHGGSWRDGEGHDYEFVGRSFAAQGYLTFVISYRLIPKFIYPAFVQDVANAVAWTNSNASLYGGNGNHIYLVGHSAGGYDVALATLNKQYMQQAGASAASIKAIATLAGPLDFLPLDTPISIDTFSQVADLASTQPVTYARADAPPFLILHGLNDNTVRLVNARSMYKHLKDVGATTKLIEYGNTSHVGIMLALAKPLRGKIPVLADIVKFFKDNSQ